MNFNGQLDTFIYTLITGILLGIIFDVYRVMRRTFKPQIWVTSFTDLLYWLLATFLVFTTIIIGNWGEVRLYVFIGLILGVISYFRFVSRIVIWLIIRIIRRLSMMARKVANLFIFFIVKPVCYVISIIKNIKHDNSTPHN